MHAARTAHRLAFVRPGVLLGVVLALLAVMPPASAAVSCYYLDPGGPPVPRVQVLYSATGDVVDIVRSGDLIHVNGGPCSDGTTNGTVTNTEYVSIITYDDPSIDDMQATISLLGGEFEPGYDIPDQGEANEVSFYLSADPPSYPSSGDVLEILGAAGAENVRFGLYVESGSEHYVNLDVDEAPDVDITDGQFDGNELYPSVDEFRFVGGGGADRASGRGGAGTGDGAVAVLVLYGQAGQDVLVGGTAPDVLRGQDQADTLSGWVGRDLLIGGPAPDVLSGQDQADTLKGSGGNDLLIGGPGPDLLVGGLGSDECRGGPGQDILRSCEN
jgi:Ca2+-binding RTX toxin-like protein